MNRTKFDPIRNSGRMKGASGRGRAAEGHESPFDRAWGYLDGPGEEERHCHGREEVYFFFMGEGYVAVDDEKQSGFLPMPCHTAEMK